MRLLLDSQLVVWWIGMRDKVPTLVQDLVDAASDGVYVSRASLWELAIKVANGKLRLDFPVFCQRIAADGFTLLGIENEHLECVARLPRFDDHKDPFDRLLVAQSLIEPLIFLTTDKALARYGSTVRIVQG